MWLRRSAYGIFGLAVLVVGLLVLQPGQAQAAGLQIRPLQYRESLVKGESKQGFVDVSNPSATPVSIQLGVEAFRQVDNGSRLQFYNSEIMRQGIQLDLTEVDLGPQEALRIYFVIKGDILPEGDVFAALFATTRTESSEGITPSARVGTLLIIENAGPGPRQADVEAIRTSVLQFGDSVSGTVTLRNTADPTKPSGFYPKVQVSLRPIAGASQQLEAPLIMAGISRDVPFDLFSNRVGFYRLTAVSGDSSASTWLFLVTGYWRWIVLGIVAGGVVLIFVYRSYRHRQRTASPRPLPGASELQAAPPDIPVSQPILPAQVVPVATPPPATLPGPDTAQPVIFEPVVPPTAETPPQPATPSPAEPIQPVAPLPVQPVQLPPSQPMALPPIIPVAPTNPAPSAKKKSARKKLKTANPKLKSRKLKSAKAKSKPKPSK